MKRLISTLFAGVLFFSGNAIAQENNFENQKKVFANLGIPEKFLNYQTKEYRSYPIQSRGRIYQFKDYLDDNKKVEVREIYDYRTDNDGKISPQPKPFAYIFDKDENGKFTEDEKWMDEYEDGLNGNENNLKNNPTSI